MESDLFISWKQPVKMGMSSASKPCNENVCMNGRGALQYLGKR